MYKYIIPLLTVCCQLLTAQEFRNPLDIPILLSGSFGELRSNHFHSGIDFKTQGVEGKAIYTVQEGYISRITVSPWGYGNGLYVTHPNGTTTVYGHLQKFMPKIADYVKQKQYEQESFSVNLELGPEELPVAANEQIAFSGNTGSSGGPHLHFEVRDTETEEPLDPLEYYKEQVKDTRPPRIHGIKVYPMPGKGVVNGSSKEASLKLVTAKNGKQTVTGKVQAWGEIGLGIKANDYMDNTSNIFGIKEMTLSVDSQVVYHSYIDRYAFDETRYLNSYTDYVEYKERRSFYAKSFVEPGNRLRFMESVNRGIITIDEPRTYQLTYRLTDNHGNITQLNIWIEGKEQPIPEIDMKGKEHFQWFRENRFGAKGIRLTIPKGNLYDDLYFVYKVKEDSTALGATHTLHNKPVALHGSAQLSLRLQTDTLENKRQYGIIQINKQRHSWIGGTYRDGWLDTNIRELGTYTLGQDTVPPKITPVNKENWQKRKAISFRLTDNLSGVQTYRGEIDGQYVLFEMNNKSIITYKFDQERLLKGKHNLTLFVTDGCGNEARYNYSFQL